MFIIRLKHYLQISAIFRK